MLDVRPSDKADQLERDFGVLHPLRRLRISLAKRDDPNTAPYNPVTPYHAHVGAERIDELETRGLEREDALIVLLMRGARIESLAKAAGEAVEDLAEQVRYRVTCLPDLESHIAESQRTLNLWWRV